MGRRVRHFSTREVGAYLLLDCRVLTGSFNSQIPEWPDLSGYNRNTVQTNSLYTPIVEIEKGLKFANFNNQNKYMIFSGSITDQPYMFFVYGFGNDLGLTSNGYYYDGYDSINRSYFRWFFIPNNDYFGMSAGSEMSKIIGGLFSAQGYRLMTGKFESSGSGSLYMNSLLWLTGSVGTNALESGITIGNSYLHTQGIYGNIGYLSITPVLEDSLRKRVDQSISFIMRHTTYGK